MKGDQFRVLNADMYAKVHRQESDYLERSFQKILGRCLDGPFVFLLLTLINQINGRITQTEPLS